MSRARSFLINFGLVIMALVIILCSLEAALALMKFNTPARVRFIPGKGITYIPHAYYRHTKEGFSEGYFNSHGFRDYERVYEKGRGVFRILVLGDSYIEALQVQLDESFAALLEKTLNIDASSTKFEVLGIGQSGFGTADEYLRYLNFGIAYNPDLVILAFLTGNDFRNNSKVLNQGGFGFYFELDEKQNLVLDRSMIDAYEKSRTYLKQILEGLKSKSHLVNLISERAYLLNRQLLESEMVETDMKRNIAGGDKPRNLDLFSDLNIYRRDLPPPWRRSIEITKGIILEFKKSVEGHGGRFLLLTLSNAEQVHSDIGLEFLGRYNVELDFDQPDRILEEFARENEVLFLNLMPAFRAYHQQTGQYLHGFGSNRKGHWNQAGHRLAAEVTFQFLKRRHLVPLAAEAP